MAQGISSHFVTMSLETSIKSFTSVDSLHGDIIGKCQGNVEATGLMRVKTLRGRDENWKGPGVSGTWGTQDLTVKDVCIPSSGNSWPIMHGMIT